MASPMEHPIWFKVWSELELRKNEVSILKSTGPGLITTIVDRYPSCFNILHKGDFIQSNSLLNNPLLKITPDDDADIDHLATASWDTGPFNALYKAIK